MKKQAPHLASNTHDQNVSTISKKRPKMTKLDIENMLQESIQLTTIHNQLLEQNKNLKKDFKKVEEAKRERQQFISMVEKIVKEKSSQLTSKSGHNSSWLVFKLQKKIYDLKNEIDMKDKAILKLKLSKENQAIFRKEIEYQCLQEIVAFAESQGLDSNPCQEDPAQQEKVKEIIWMEDYYESEEQKMINLAAEYEQQERETKRILMKLAEKKSQLKRIKQIQREYVQAQENYKQQKKKKQENTNKKTYFSNLMRERDNENQKLEELKQKKRRIQLEEEEEIKKLQKKLQQVKAQYQNSKSESQETKQKTMKIIKNQSTQQWVKRVQHSEVDFIAANMNYTLSLKGVSQEQWTKDFFKDGKESYSIQNIVEKFGEYPFEWKNEGEKKLLARYVVEDNGCGFMLEDMNTLQLAPIIRSILANLIGRIKVYDQTEKNELTQKVGDKLCKFWSLVVQVVQTKEGNIKLATKSMIQEGIQNAEIDFSQEEIDFAVLYLYSWSEDAGKLELQKLGKLLELGVKWPVESSAQ